MAIDFQSPTDFFENRRKRFQKMSDQELIRFGKAARSLSGSRPDERPDSFKMELEEARSEWRRRHRK